MEKAKGILRTCDNGVQQLVTSLAAGPSLDEEQDLMDTYDTNKKVIL